MAGTRPGRRERPSPRRWRPRRSRPEPWRPRHAPAKPRTGPRPPSWSPRRGRVDVDQVEATRLGARRAGSLGQLGALPPGRCRSRRPLLLHSSPVEPPTAACGGELRRGRARTPWRTRRPPPRESALVLLADSVPPVLVRLACLFFVLGPVVPVDSIPAAASKEMVTDRTEAWPVSRLAPARAPFVASRCTHLEDFTGTLKRGPSWDGPHPPRPPVFEPRRWPRRRAQWRSGARPSDRRGIRRRPPARGAPAAERTSRILAGYSRDRGLEPQRDAGSRAGRPQAPLRLCVPTRCRVAGGSGPAGGLQLGRRLASPEASAGGGPAAGVSLCPSCRGATGMDQTFLARGSRHRK